MEQVIDATNQRLGRLATKIALILQGKNRADYQPRLEGKDGVLVKNVSRIILTGKKVDQKVYHYHTGYVGHLRTIPFKDMKAKHPERVLQWAVYNMLPKNFLRQKRMNRLKIEK
jgi:large subunit ribosomal protein L13